MNNFNFDDMKPLGSVLPVTVNGGYACECHKCHKSFFGNKHDIYCDYCKQVVELKESNEKLMRKVEKLTLENNDLKDLLCGMKKNIEILLRSFS